MASARFQISPAWCERGLKPNVVVKLGPLFHYAGEIWNRNDHSLSSAEAPYGKFYMIILGLEGRTGNDGKRERAESRLSFLFPLPGIPRALPFFPLPRPTAKKPLRSKQDERGLCGGERRSLVILNLCLRKNWEEKSRDYRDANVYIQPRFQGLYSRF